jgi:Putative DNA-binding domain
MLREAEPRMLHEVQRTFRDAVLSDTAVAFERAGIRLGVAPRDCLDIYRNNVLHAVTRALALSFPGVERMVGEAFFEAMAARFVRWSPPRSAWLDRYGEGFAEFIARFEPAAALPYLADLARLEWAVASARLADPLPVLALDALTTLDQSRIVHLSFETHPSLALIDSRFPVDELRQAAIDADESTLARLAMNAGPVHLLVRATARALEIVRLGEAAFRFTRLLAAGATLGAALNDVPEEADGKTLALHLAGGSFTDFHMAAATDER